MGPIPTHGPDEDAPHRRETTTGDPHPVEHFLEVLLIAQDRAANETNPGLRRMWEVTIRDIETVLADDTLQIVDARDKLAQRSDPEARSLHACACQLLRAHDAANREAMQAIARARRGAKPS